ncbi:unnamed protein product [Rotaria socialis]
MQSAFATKSTNSETLSLGNPKAGFQHLNVMCKDRRTLTALPKHFGLTTAGDHLSSRSIMNSAFAPEPANSGTLLHKNPKAGFQHLKTLWVRTEEMTCPPFNQILPSPRNHFSATITIQIHLHQAIYPSLQCPVGSELRQSRFLSKPGI